MPPPTYEEIYQSLPVRDSQTRLLRLQPSKRYEDDLVCTLSVMDLDSEPVSADDYVALSYSWGDEARDHTVLCSGLSIKVTKSCFNALRALRQQGEQRIWIDQLCVDQTTIAERSNQVALMYKTFRQAQKTYVFLGLLPDLIAALHCDFLPRRMSPSQALCRLLDQDEGKTTGELLSMSLVTKTQMREMLRAASSELHGDSVSQLKALMEEAIVCLSLLNCRYPQRRWPLQEIALAKRAEVLLDGHRFPFDALCTMCWRYHSWRYEMIALQREEIGSHKPQPLSRLGQWWSNVHRGHEALMPLLRWHEQLEAPSKQIDCLSALQLVHNHFRRGEVMNPIRVFAMAYSLHATEPLDYIHALRALIPKNEALPAADYAQKYDAACITHSRWLLHEGYAHDILCSGALWLELSAKIPSWTMTFGRPPRSRTRTGQVTYYEDPTLYVNDGTTPAVQAAQWQAEGLHMNWKATGETIDFQHVLPVAVSLIWPSIPRSSASIEDDALRIGGFQLDSLADIDANSFYAYRTRRVVSGLHLVWEFYKQTAVRQTNEVESFVERAGWWEEFNMSEGPRVNRGGLFGAESILFYTSGAAAADMAPCAARLAKHGDLRNYQQTDSTQSSSAVRSASSPLRRFICEGGWPEARNRNRARKSGRMVFGITRDGWPVLVPFTAQVNDAIAFLHGSEKSFVLRDCGNGRYRLRGRCHVLGLMYGFGWTVRPEASKHVRTFDIV